MMINAKNGLFWLFWPRFMCMLGCFSRSKQFNLCFPIISTQIQPIRTNCDQKSARIDEKCQKWELAGKFQSLYNRAILEINLIFFFACTTHEVVKKNVVRGFFIQGFVYVQQPVFR